MVLTLTGCAVDPTSSFPSQRSLQSLTGVVLERQDQLWFQPCNEKLWWPLQDYTQQQELTKYYQQLTAFSDQELYVELQGVIDPGLDNSLLVKQVDTVGGTAATCHFRLPGVEYRAAGSQPYWLADIAVDRVVVKSIQPLGSFSFKTLKDAADSVEPAVLMGRDRGDFQPASPVVARYREVKPSRQPFQIRIRQQRCIDAENGTVLPLTAQMTFQGREYQGCARKGHPAEETLSGFYWYQSAAGEQVMFKLSDDHKVQLVSRDATGKAVTERGRWQYLQSGKLIFSMRDPKQHEYLMLFRRLSAGQLVLQTGSERLATVGASFQLWRPSGLAGGQSLPNEISSPTTMADRVVAAEPDNAVDVEPVVRQSAAASLLTGALLIESPVRAADIDDELINEIRVDDAQTP